MILVNAGPLVALCDRDDQHFAECAQALQTFREPLATIWPPLTEALYVLHRFPRGQHALWQMLLDGGLGLLELGLGDIPRIRELMEKYADRRMDLADAALIAVAEREGIRKFFTTDRKDFAAFRLHHRTRPIILP